MKTKILEMFRVFASFFFSLFPVETNKQINKITGGRSSNQKKT